MKCRFIFFSTFVVSLIALVSCQKDEGPVVGKDSYLLTFLPFFEHYDNVTKGKMIESSVDSFYVKMWNTGADAPVFGFSKVKQFTHSGGSQKTYWSTVDDDGKLVEHYWGFDGSQFDNKTFFAYANLPESGTVVQNDNLSEMVISYTVPKLASDQTDILVVMASGNGEGPDIPSPGTIGRVVNLSFLHMLSAVKFEIDNISGWEIVEIKLENVYSEGRYSVNYNGVQFLSSSGTTDVTMSDVNDTFFLVKQVLKDKTPKVKVKLQSGEAQKEVSASLGGTIKQWDPRKRYTYQLNFTPSTKSSDGLPELRVELVQ